MAIWSPLLTKSNSQLIKKALYFLLFSIAHLMTIVAIMYAFWPIAKWYLNYRPVWGVDFFLLNTLTHLLSENLVWPPASWNYGWFAGFPMFFYPFLHVYIGVIFNHFFDLVVGTQLWMLASTALLVIGSYFLFFTVSRNFILSGVLAMATAYSSGVYQTLTWAGSLPSYATQAALPWSLGFLVLFLRTGKTRFLFACSLVAGVSFFGHPLTFVIYIVPAAMILIFTRFSQGLALYQKIKISFIFLTLSIVIALPIFGPTFGSAIKNAFKPSYSQNALSTTDSAAAVDIGAVTFNKLQPVRMITDNHIAPFMLAALSAGLFLASILLARRLLPILDSLPYVLVAAYFAFYVWLFGQGISIYHGGWYRLFWHVPIWIGMVASALWYESFVNFAHVVKTKFLRLILNLGASLAVLAIGGSLLYAFNFGTTITQIIYRSQVSSAHPDAINLKITDNERQELKHRLVPFWLNGDETNWRLYDGDQTVNIWWNSLFKMPLARGYLDPPITNDKRGFIFLLDTGLSESDGEAQLVQAFNYPLEVAISNVLFLVDWNAVLYFEGGHVGGSYTPVPRHLEEILVSRQETLEFNDLRYTKRPVTLSFYQFKDDLVSPILSGTNASSVGIFASDGGYETVVRAIAERDNLNSQRVIPLKLGRVVDDYNLATLAQFDALYLYDWDYKSDAKVYKLLTSFVQSGKKVFVETGVEVKASSGQLPEFFPVKSVERKGQGKEWGLESSRDPLTANVDVNQFSPPVFDDDEWKLSFSEEKDLRAGAEIVLKNHGKVVMARHKLGSGEIIWSGLNFAYHLSRDHNPEEAKFFVNILGSLVDLSKKQVPSYQVTFENANNRLIEVQGARGILFKEMVYDGWTARVIKSDNNKTGGAEIFKAGPADPGFMYIPISEGKQMVRLSYGGSLGDKVLISVSILAVILLVDEVVLGGLLLGRLRKIVFGHVSKKVRGWWQKENE